MRRAALAAALAVFLAVASGASAAQLLVGAGSTLDLGTGSLDLGCADLEVAGTLFAGTNGIDQARDVTLTGSGVLHGESATLNVTGDWSKAGAFSSGTGTVEFLDGCERISAVITGDTTFANLDMTTTTGKAYEFAAGSTQTVTLFVSLLGAAGNLLVLRSTIDCVKAFIDNQGVSFGDFVDVDCVGTVTNKLFLGLNSVIGPNSEGMGFVISLPALGALSLVLLLLLLLWGGWYAFSNSRPRWR